MAFKSPIVVRGTIKGDAPFNNKQSRSLNRRDLLIYVTNYDLERNLICGNHVQNGRYMEVSIDPQEVARGREQEQQNPEKFAEAPYLGHSIDARMKSHIIPDGAHIAILEGAEVTKKLNKIVNGEAKEIRLVRCRRISNGGTNTNKVFEALITFTRNNRFNSVERIQCWKPEAIDASNIEAVEALAERLDKVFATHINAQAEIKNVDKNTSYLPIVGVELRTVRTNDNPADGSKIIDLSGRMERINAEYDITTNTVISPSTPINGTVFKQNLEAYTQYVRQTYGENVRIEIATYTSYPAGFYNNDFDFNEMRSPYSPFLQMTSARSKIAVDEEAFVEGGNYGCWGVVSISKDKTDDSGTVIPRYYVNRAYISSNSKGFVHYKIRSVDGQYYDLEENLKGPILRYSTTQALPLQNTIPVVQPVQPVPTTSYSSHPTYDTYNVPRTIMGWEDDDIPFGNTPPSVVSRPRP